MAGNPIAALLKPKAEEVAKPEKKASKLDGLIEAVEKIKGLHDPAEVRVLIELVLELAKAKK